MFLSLALENKILRIVFLCIYITLILSLFSSPPQSFSRGGSCDLPGTAASGGHLLEGLRTESAHQPVRCGAVPAVGDRRQAGL